MHWQINKGIYQQIYIIIDRVIRCLIFFLRLNILAVLIIEDNPVSQLIV